MTVANVCSPIGKGSAGVTSPVPPIGPYVQDTGMNGAGTLVSGPGPSASGPFIGCNGGAAESANNGLNGASYWMNNWLGEIVTQPYVVPANSGAATGKTAQWVWTNLAPLTVPTDGRVTITAGVAVAASGAGLSKTFIKAGTVIPVKAYFWAFLI